MLPDRLYTVKGYVGSTCITEVTTKQLPKAMELAGVIIERYDVPMVKVMEHGKVVVLIDAEDYVPSSTEEYEV